MVWDTIIIGGGFYGCYLAQHYRTAGGSVLVLEQEKDIMRRASYVNQARVHNGYHYPRNYLTALRSTINFPRFVTDFYPAIDHTFEKYYAIARHNSKITPDQFYAFCKKIGAPIRELHHPETIFAENLVQKVYIVKEFAFNATIIRSILQIKLRKMGVTIKQECNVRRIWKHKDIISVESTSGTYEARNVCICAYSGINGLLSNSGLPMLPMKHEITEMALVRVPKELLGCAITLMDGPFFSLMPFPDRGLHSLSHVRYTPHASWIDSRDDIVQRHDPYKRLTDYDKKSHFPFMVKDAGRYIPLLSQCTHVDSLFEIKSVLMNHEEDDGRPILYEKNYIFDGLSVIMGGKMDNIYDVVEGMKSLSSGI